MSQIITYRTTDDSEKVILLVKDIKGGTHELGPVNHADLLRYMEGAFVQTAFPYLTSGERELIMSGYTEDMWNDLVSGIGSL
jgi:hypothetical protein